jgi:hypothetical protein
MKMRNIKENRMEGKDEIIFVVTKSGTKDMANAEQKTSHLWRDGIEVTKYGIRW